MSEEWWPTEWEPELLPTRNSPLGWHVIPGELLLDALRRVEAGEAPEDVFASLCVNVEREHVD